MLSRADVERYEKQTGSRSIPLRRAYNRLIGGGKKRSSNWDRPRSEDGPTKKKAKSSRDYNCFEKRSAECDQRLREAVWEYFEDNLHIDCYTKKPKKVWKRLYDDEKIENGQLIVGKVDNWAWDYKVNRKKETSIFEKRVPVIIPVDGHMYAAEQGKLVERLNIWPTIVRPATQEDIDRFNAFKQERFRQVGEERLKPFREAAQWVNNISNTYNEGTRDLICQNLTYTDPDAIKKYHSLHREISKANAFAAENGFEVIPLSEHQPVGSHLPGLV